MANVVGQRVRRREDPRFLTGKGQYVDDLQPEGALHVTFVRSPWAHARITSVDKSAAEELPDTQVFTAADVELAVNPAPPFVGIDERMFRPFLASQKARFAGDIVAVVLSGSRGSSVDAGDLVAVEYEPLPAVTDIEEAARDEVLLFEEMGTNVCLERPLEADEQLFDGCDVVTSGSIFSQRLAACPVEPRGTIAEFGDDGRLTVWLSTQTPHTDKMVLGLMLGLEPDNVRVVAPDVGGGFGGKGLAVEDVLIAYLARKTGRTLRWTETRSENLVAMHQGRAQRIRFEIGGTKDGVVKALRWRILQDGGAYPGIGSFLANLTALMASGVYAIPKIEIGVRAVVTNTTPTGPVRGAGRPEATQALERGMDMFASDCGLDPAEVRRRNFIPKDAFPHQTAAGAHYDCGDFARRARARAHVGRLRGPARGAGAPPPERNREAARHRPERLRRDHQRDQRDRVRRGRDHPGRRRDPKTGSQTQGQGHETTFAMIVADRVGIPVEKITVIKGDTDEVARGSGTYGSKSTQIGGAAAAQASEDVVEKAKRLAAEELEANPEDMVLDLDKGRFHVTGAPEPALSWSDLAGRLQSKGLLQELSAEADFTASQPTFPFGAHVAVVEVDTETGAVQLQRMIAVDDAGVIINPLVADGQVHGGLAAGIAQALFEELTYDEDGNPLNSNLVTYGFPSARELPALERIEMVTPTPINALGAKGIGESGTIGATPAVHNAVIDALSPYGIRHIDMPVNGERVWRAIQDAAGPA